MLCLLMIVAAISGGCGSPPSRPESLWDSLPSADEGMAQNAPAKVWEGEGPGSEPGGEAPEIAGAVVLNEIFYDSADSDTDGNLFVELYGTPELSLAGCKINFVNGADGSMTDSVALPAGAKTGADGFYVIADAKTGSSLSTNVPGFDLIDNFDPQNGPDAVQLLDAKGGLVDAVGYGDEIQPVAENGLASFEGAPAVDVAVGHSLERKAPGLDTENNAGDFVDREAPTPGSSPDESGPPVETPSPPENPVVLNEIYYDAVGSDTNGVLFVELYGTPGTEIEGYRVDFVDGADGSADDSVTLPPQARLRDDGFYLIADSKDGSSTDTDIFGSDFIDGFDPQNGPDAVQLLDAGGNLVDAVGYGVGLVLQSENGLAMFEGTAAMDAMNGHGLERREPGLDSSDNSEDFIERESPTPGF
jgi:hypothetical protein